MYLFVVKDQTGLFWCDLLNIVISVKDDSVGFYAQEETERLTGLKGLALFSIRERLTYLGRNIGVDSKRR